MTLLFVVTRFIKSYVPAPVYQAIITHYAGKQFVSAWSSLIPAPENLQATLSREAAGLEAFSSLMERYSEPHRVYHNLSHVMDCIDELSEFDYQYKDDLTGALRLSPTDRSILTLAIWFHDAIYDPKAKDNEEKSAEIFTIAAQRAGMNESAVQQIGEMILATKTHVASTPNTAILLDIDLSILGRQESAFTQYDAQIRAEYDFVPRLLYYPARYKIMQEFLARPRLFTTDYFHAKYDEQARKNLSTIKRFSDS